MQKSTPPKFYTSQRLLNDTGSLFEDAPIKNIHSFKFIRNTTRSILIKQTRLAVGPYYDIGQMLANDM